MNNSNKDWSRRHFLGTLACAGTALSITPQLSWAVNQFDPKIAALAQKILSLGIDTHNHIDVPLLREELPGPEIDLAGAMTQSGLAAICMTFAVDYQKLVNPGDAYNSFITGLDAMDIILEKNNMKRSLNAADIKKAYQNKTKTVIQSVEGGHFLEGNIDRLAVAYDRGLRHLGLLHDNDANVPLGDVFTNPVKFGGLTSFGADVIRACNKMGILIDLSHADNATVNAALKISDRPVLISHTGLNTQLGTNENMARMMKPRLISKEQAKIVAGEGGVIGVWTHLADTPLEYAQNLRAMVEVTGIEHVCIGTDTKMTPPYRSPKDQFKSKENFQANHNEHGERSNNGNEQKKHQKMGATTNESWAEQKQGFYYSVTENLLKVGFTENEIEKIGGGNFCRIFEKATNA